MFNSTRSAVGTIVLMGGAGAFVPACTGGTAPPMACSAAATPDVRVTLPFQIDTAGPPNKVGADYGQPACPDQLLVDIDLTQPAFRGHGFFVSGRWSISLPAFPCDERATLSVSTFDGTTWKPWDVVTYLGTPQGHICHAQAQSHTNFRLAGLGGVSVPADPNYQRVRVAMNATENQNKVPVMVIGEAK